MSADLGKGRRSVRDSATIPDDRTSGKSCPWRCLADHVALYPQGSTEVAATQCTACDNVVTRLGWLAELERAAGSRP